MDQHPNLHSDGFPTSTIFTLGTKHGVVLIHMHTTGDNLHFFGTFINQWQHDLNLHWTNFMPGEDTTDITHKSISVPVEDKHPIFRTQISQRPLNTVVPPTNPTVPNPEGSSTNNSTSAIFPQDKIIEQQENLPSSPDKGYQSGQSFFKPEVQQAGLEAQENQGQV